MPDDMTDEMIEKAEKTFSSFQDYFDAYAEEHGKAGFVWITNQETGELAIYTRGEYRHQLSEFIKTLD